MKKQDSGESTAGIRFLQHILPAFGRIIRERV